MKPKVAEHFKLVWVEGWSIKTSRIRKMEPFGSEFIIPSIDMSLSTTSAPCRTGETTDIRHSFHLHSTFYCQNCSKYFMYVYTF